MPKDAKWLKLNRFRAVLDLQFTPTDYSKKSHNFIRDTLEEQSIEYLPVPMNDGENSNIESLFEVGYNQLADWDEKFTLRNEKILVKCGVGVSRSVAMLIYYYCVRDRLTYTEAKIRISAKDIDNYGGLPISIDMMLEIFLKSKFPDLTSAFGERIG